MTDQEKFIVLVFNEPLKNAEAIILLAGDGFSRCQHAAWLYKQGWAKKIVISGGIANYNYGSYPAKELLPELIKLGVKKSDVILDEQSMNTRDQAVNIVKLAREKKWKKIILVASHYHQSRAFLTFLQARKEARIKIQIINSPVSNLSWFVKNKWGKRIDLLEFEFNKIKLYAAKGHLASFAEAIKYQEWKEGQK